VQKAILDYLRFFVIDKIGPDDLPKRNESAFLRYEKLLRNRTTFRWEDSPVSRNWIEQINLCRNDFIHVSKSMAASHANQQIISRSNRPHHLMILLIEQFEWHSRKRTPRNGAKRRAY
jgi:hypothetical protein